MRYASDIIGCVENRTGKIYALDVNLLQGYRSMQ
jgi:hypothetical protein